MGNTNGGTGFGEKRNSDPEEQRTQLPPRPHQDQWPWTRGHISPRATLMKVRLGESRLSEIGRIAGGPKAHNDQLADLKELFAHLKHHHTIADNYHHA